MPSYRHHDYGNLYVQFDVKFPANLLGPNGEPMSDEARMALESVLPPRNIDNKIPDDAMVEDYTLENIDVTREGARAHGAAMDDDDEDGHGHGERVQCASQ
jgi:DnaJ homolog subfamily A member 2